MAWAERPPLVGLDEGAGGHGDPGRERDLAEELVKMVLRGGLRPQIRPGRGDVIALMLGEAIYLGFQAVVGGPRNGQVSSGERPHPAAHGSGRSALRGDRNAHQRLAGCCGDLEAADSGRREW